MAYQALSTGMPWSCTQNVSYALPAKIVRVQSSLAVDVSSNESTWSALTGAETVGAETGASFIRCTTGIAVITCKVK